jgi:hypothetical protein
VSLRNKSLFWSGDLDSKHGSAAISIACTAKSTAHALEKPLCLKRRDGRPQLFP